MPNEIASRLCAPHWGYMPMHGFGAVARLRQRPPVHPALRSVPGALALPVFRGRTLYLPLYERPTFESIEAEVGFSGLEFISIGAQTVAKAASFIAEIAASVAKTIFGIIKSIVDFIVSSVVAVVRSVINAVSGLVGAVIDAIGLKKDGDLTPDKAAELAGILSAKASSLESADTKTERPMTQEEKEAFDRNMSTARSGIGELAGGLVEKLGGPVNTIIIGAGVAGAIFLATR